MRKSSSLAAAIVLSAGSYAAHAQNGTVEYRIREITGQTIAGPGDAVLNFTIEGRVVGATDRGLGDWYLDVRFIGEAEGSTNGTLARLRISNSDGAYFTGAPTTSSTGGGLLGMATQYRYIVGLNANSNGVINSNVGTFTNGPDQEIGFIRGSARGATLANTGIIVDPIGDGNFVPVTGTAFTTALNTWFGANGNWIELYRFRYNVANLTPRALSITLENPLGLTFANLVAAGSDWSAATTGGTAQVSITNLQIDVGDLNNSCAALPAPFIFTGLGFTASGDSAFATTDGFAVVSGGIGGCAPSNPLVAPVSVADVWYRFTPSESDPFTISLCSTAAPWNTVLSVHSACPDSLSSNTIACNDDASCGLGLSQITGLQLSAGVPYLIRVARSGATGSGAPFVLDVAGPPRGSCCQFTGECAITRQIDCSATWTSGGACAPNPCPITIALVRAGAGRGTVVSQNPPATCPTSCTLVVSNATMIELAAQPQTDSTFTGWSGLCTGTGPCQFSAVASGDAIANFRCRAEFDDVSGVGVGDIFGFLNAWFSRDPRADIDGFDGVNTADIFGFLNAWYRACRE